MSRNDTIADPFDLCLKDSRLASLVGKSEQYTEIVLEYCLLALRDTLSEVEQERLGEIFGLAMTDSILSF